jgi:curved DNA-binding protein CbpA
MNGQLSEQPVAELIREISLKSLSGRLRLEHDRVKVVAYFNRGQFLYAASNLKTLRIREYLKKGELISDKGLAQFNERDSDIDVVKVLLAQKLLSPAAAEELQTRQVADVLRLTLLWTEGSWEFDSRSRLDEQLNLKISVDALVLEAARRLPAKLAATRFRNAAEMISPLAEPLLHDNLLPTEGYMLSRLDRPMTVRELTAISGLAEDETLALVYSLAIAGLVKREHWNSVFRGDQKTQPSREEPRREEPKPVAPTERERDPSREADAEEVEAFLARVRNAQTHYDVLGAGSEASAADLKTVYYQLARRYHPDRFRKADPVLVTRIESAFARITQAYDTLRDDGLRASYNAKLQARRKVEQLADTAPKPTTASPQPESVAENPAEPVISVAERAETHFKEGFAQLEMGQLKAALSLFASAARAVPSEPRYRAYYGQMLARNENTRRAAEAELNAAVKLDPENSEYRVMLAELYRDLGLKLRAKGEAERAVAADPNNGKARELLRALK